MSGFGRACTVNGLRCALVTGGGEEFRLLFEREYAGPEQLEGTDWAHPEIAHRAEGCSLPEGYGFELKDITYSHGKRCYAAHVRVARQFLGNVEAANARADALSGQLAEADEAVIALYEQLEGKDAEIAALNSQIAEADETVIALYEQLLAGSGEAPEPDQDGGEEPEPDQTDAEEVSGDE